MAQRPGSWLNPPWWFALVTLPWLIGVALLASEVRDASAIATREQTTKGVITAHDPGNHDSYQYSYSVGGRTFHSWQIPYRVAWRLGEQVVVFYDPLEPTVSSLVEFGDRNDEDIGTIQLLLLGIIGILSYIGYRRFRNLRPKLRN